MQKNIFSRKVINIKNYLPPRVMKARSFDIFEVNKYLQDWGIEVYGELAPKRKLSQHRLAMIMLNGGVGLRGLVTSYCSHFLVFSTGTGSTRGKSWGVLLAFYTANKASQVTLKKSYVHPMLIPGWWFVNLILCRAAKLQLDIGRFCHRQ